MGEFALGQPVSRFEDQRLLRGGGRYVDDMVLPGMAYGHVLRSPYAHARIRAIDTSKAKAAPGVLAVLTGADWEASGYADLPVPKSAWKRPDGSPMYRPRYRALAKDRVRWVGDYVAFIVAETRAQAVDAADLVEVDYEPLPAIVSTAEALKEGAPLVWDDCPNNICFNHQFGDKAAVDTAFAKADHVVSHSFVINRVYAAAMEPRGAIGHYDSTDGRYTVYTTLQRAHAFRAELAGTLRIPESRLRVVAGNVGGSFGMKSAVYNEVALVLLASRVTGRPVKWTASRSESFLGDAHGRDNVSEASLALNKNGRFLAMRVKNTVAIGAQLQTGGDSSSTGNLGTLAGVYTTPAIHVDVTTVFTNTNPMRPYRGNGRPEAAYVIERLVDIAAAELGIDRVEIRRRNIIPPDAMPFKTGLTFTYDCGEFEKGMDMALEMADYAGFEKRRAEARKRGKLRGFGLSNSIERAAAPGYEMGEIRFDRSGTCSIISGAVDQGQGHETIFKQLVCDRLGLDPGEVHYVSGDTDKVALGEGTGGSRSATIGGSALLMASDKVIAKGRRIAAHILEVDAGDVDFADGVFSSPKSNRSLTIKEVAKLAVNPKMVPDGLEPGLAEVAVYRNLVTNFPNGCHVCEIEIDEETGQVRIVAYGVVDDVGFVMNPLLLHGQIQGGVAQGVGQMLMEDIHFDPETGQNLTGSFMDYAMPHATDFAPIRVKSNPVPTRTNPLGVKGAGEAGNVGALPAVGNALADALSVYGIRDVPMPATAERLWRLIQASKAARAAA
ncbi:MAG TPA: xanthine dehydrogenase family protein molybdopterin-binding subunit [Alphaproteobacteria bacterium]